MTVSAMKKLAKLENEAMRRSWEGGIAKKTPPKKRRKRRDNTLFERLRPYIGKGMTQKQVGEILGVSRGPISRVCSEHGIDWRAENEAGRVPKPQASLRVDTA
jgi:hypothetical protein